MFNIRNTIYSVSGQNHFDELFRKSKDSIYKEILNQSFVNYIVGIHEYDKLLSKKYKSRILKEISNSITISEKELNDKAKLRVIGNIIVQLNIWALYINKHNVDMSLVNDQIRGDILGFLRMNRGIYLNLQQQDIPLINLHKLVNYWLK